MKEVVAGCILKDGKVYLARRSTNISPECIGKFEFPGGSVEEGETYEEALIRELKEELNVDVRVIKLIHAQINSYSRSGPFLVLFFLCLLRDENQTPNADTQIIYLRPEEVEYWDILPGAAEAADKLKGKYKEILEKYKVEQTPEFTARVLSYEIGDIHKLLIYKERFGSTGYLGDLKHACADTLAMIGLLSEQLGYNLAELKEIGLERFTDRMQEVKRNE